MQLAEANALTAVVANWSIARDDICAMAMVGSWARGDPRPRSDLDLLIVGTAGLDGRVVHAVFVAPDTQRRGVGRLLMAEVEKAARSAGMEMLVVQSSVTAVPFYARLGFKAVRDHYYGEEHTIIMELPLAAI